MPVFIAEHPLQVEQECYEKWRAKGAKTRKEWAIEWGCSFAVAGNRLKRCAARELVQSIHISSQNSLWLWYFKPSVQMARPKQVVLDSELCAYLSLPLTNVYYWLNKTACKPSGYMLKCGKLEPYYAVSAVDRICQQIMLPPGYQFSLSLCTQLGCSYARLVSKIPGLMRAFPGFKVRRCGDRPCYSILTRNQLSQLAVPLTRVPAGGFTVDLVAQIRKVPRHIAAGWVQREKRRGNIAVAGYMVIGSKQTAYRFTNKGSK